MIKNGWYALTKLNILNSYEMSKEKHDAIEECLKIIQKELEILDELKFFIKKLNNERKNKND